jgi:hypothetical protein
MVVSSGLKSKRWSYLDSKNRVVLRYLLLVAGFRDVGGP